MNISERDVANAATWSFAGHAGALLLQISGTIILARLLAPSAFGLISLLTILWGIGNQISGSGLGGALLRQKVVPEDDWSTVFYFNMAAGLCCFLLLFFCAPWIALFYRKPELTEIIRVCAVILPVGALGTTRNLYLAKYLRRRAIMLIQLSSGFLSLTLAILAAIGGLGVWSLAIQLITNQMTTTLLLFVRVPRLPGKRFDFAAFRRLYDFGCKMFAAGLINTIFDNLYSMVIGKIYSFKELGFYDKATRIGGLPSAGISGVMSAILLPYLAKYQDDRQELQMRCRAILKIATGVVVLLSIILFSSGESLILLFMGEKWLPVVPLMQVIALSGILMPIHVINVQLMLIMNRPGWFLLSDILKKMLYILALAMTFRYGVYIMVAGQFGIAVFAAVINAWFGRLLIGYGFVKQMADVAPLILGGGIAGGLVYLLTGGIRPDYLQLPIAAASAVLFYLLPVCCYYKINPVRLIREHFFLKTDTR